MERPTLTAEITLPLSQIVVEVIPTAAVATAPSTPTIAVSLKFKNGEHHLLDNSGPSKFQDGSKGRFAQC